MAIVKFDKYSVCRGWQEGDCPDKQSNGRVQKMFSPGEHKIWIGKIGGAATGALQCGIGPESTGNALAGLLERYSCERVIVVGVCGALDRGMALGTVALAGSVTAEWLDDSRIELPAMIPGALENEDYATVKTDCLTLRQPLADNIVAEKFMSKHGAFCVDMESWVIADYFARHSIPVYIVKAVSDHAGPDASSEFAEWGDRAMRNSAEAGMSLARQLDNS